MRLRSGHALPFASVLCRTLYKVDIPSFQNPNVWPTKIRMIAIPESELFGYQNPNVLDVLLDMAFFVLAAAYTGVARGWSNGEDTK